MSGTVFLADPEMDVNETTGFVDVVIRRTGSLIGDVTIIYGITADGATEGADYVGTGGSIVMPSGADRVVVPVSILNDTFGETTETVVFSLISVEGASLFAPRTSRIAILDDETPPPPPEVEPPLVSDYDVTQVPLVEGLDQPIRFEFAAFDPRLIYVAEKAGVIRLANITTGTSTVVLDISSQVNNSGDRGLMDIALHPDLANNPYLYAFFVVDPPESASRSGRAGLDGDGNRYAHVVRYTLDAAAGYASVVAGSGVVIAGTAGTSLADISGNGADDYTNPSFSNRISSERYLAPGDATPPTVIAGIKQDYIKVDSTSHAGGALVFGPDGALYISVGDGTSYNYADPRTVDVQSLSSTSGKILRVDALTGRGLADNPFAADAPSLDANQAKVFQLGLRNPFSLAFNAEGRLFASDTGWNNYEELNAGGPGANFGWPWYEGGDGGELLPTSGYSGFAAAGAFYAAVASGEVVVTPAFRAFAHNSAAPGFQIQAITAGEAVYTGTVYPEALRNDLFFSDFSGNEVYTVDTLDSSKVNFLYRNDGPFGPSHFVQGPDGYIYYADLVTGRIGRLEITAPGAQPPQTLRLNGSATQIDAATNEFQLTDVGDPMVGGVAGETRIDLRQDARFGFDVYLGTSDAGADGIAFILHNDPAGANALGYAAEAIGVRPLRSVLALEFDTGQDLPYDPVYDHGFIYAPNAPAFGVGQADLVNLGNIEDGRWHSVVVTWSAATQTLAYSFDGVARDQVTGDVIAQVFGGSPFVHFGWTASTGGGVWVNDQRVRLSAIDVTYENVAGEQAPILFGGDARYVQVEGGLPGSAYRPAASDADGGTLSWRTVAADDAALFTIDGATGALSFVTPPDAAKPNDLDGDGVYRVTIEVMDTTGLADRQVVDIAVNNWPSGAILGTAAPETLRGTSAADVLIALGGNDTAIGGDGDDTFMATVNDGNDTYNGDGGRDLYSLELISADAVVSLAAKTASSPQTGNDKLNLIENATGGRGNDQITGSNAANVLRGLNGDDTLAGSGGDDTLDGGDGNDRLDGGTGVDTMAGGAGDDTYLVDNGADAVIEADGDGLDTVNSSVSFTLAAAVENLVLTGNGATSGTGNALANLIKGNGKANQLLGRSGDDTIEGGNGNDLLVGGLGADILNGGGGNDIFRFNGADEGGDTIIAYVASQDTIQVSAGGFGAGLAAGMNLVATGRYVANASGEATAAFGQFVYETDTALLRWDADGTAAGAAVVIASLTGATGWNGAEIVVFA